MKSITKQKDNIEKANIDPTNTVKIASEQFLGPIPHPDILNQYDLIIPDAANRILKMAEEDARHQREMEKAAIQFASEETRRGQLYGLIIGLSAFITSIVALYLGSEKTAIALGGTTAVGLVTAFITGSIIKQKNPTKNSH